MNLLELPPELLLPILKHLLRSDKLSCRSVSNSFRRLVDCNFFYVPTDIFDPPSATNGLEQLLQVSIPQWIPAEENPPANDDEKSQRTKPTEPAAATKPSVLLTVHSEFDFNGRVNFVNDWSAYNIKVPGCKDFILVQRWRPAADPQFVELHGWTRRPIANFCPSTELPVLWCQDSTFAGVMGHSTEWCRIWIRVRKNSPFASFRGYDEQDILPAQFRRLHWDCQLSYGDGGHRSHVFPIYYTVGTLGFYDEWRRKLVRILLALDDDRQDIQSNGVVHDLLDPDLYGNPIPDGSRWKRLEQEHKFFNYQYKNAYSSDCMRAIAKRRLHLSENIAELPPTVELRERYHWVPSDVRIHRGKTLEFLSHIHGLPLPKHKALCRKIGTVLQEMLPMFSRIGLFPQDGSTCDRQVVVKIQSYVLPPQSTYKGKWHVEGVTENVSAVGVYYCDVDPSLEGGALKFRTPSTAMDGYFKTDPCFEPEELPVSTGTAVVFPNQIPHRFRKITNATSEPRRRLFINFFFIDPLRPLASTRTIPNLYESYSIGEAKAFRDRVRQGLSAQRRDGWWYWSWGNSGEADFINHAQSVVPLLQGLGYRGAYTTRQSDSDLGTQEFFYNI